MAKKVKQSFESAIEALESIIKQLENGTLTLEESIENYKKGMELAGFCSEVLQKAEQEIFIYEENSFKKQSGECEDER